MAEMSNKEFERLINNKSLLRFKMPKNMKSYLFKRRKRYTHEVELTLVDCPQAGTILHFTSGEAARDAERSNRKAVNVESVKYTKTEILNVDDKGHILQ